MNGHQAARDRLVALEQRISAIYPVLPPAFWELRQNIRRVLEQAHMDGCLKQPSKDIRPPLYQSKEPDGYGVAVITGGRRSETWADGGQFERDDGARFNFSIVVSYQESKPNEPPKAPSLIAYHFNLAFPDNRVPAFVRFDLNEAKFASESRDAARSPLLCHSHPGHSDMTVPSPILAPEEVLDVILRMHLR